MPMKCHLFDGIRVFTTVSQIRKEKRPHIQRTGIHLQTVCLPSPAGSPNYPALFLFFLSFFFIQVAEVTGL